MTFRAAPNDRYSALNAELEACLTECANGDRTAFAAICSLTSGKFTAIIMKMVRDEATCEDILQKAYMSIWKNAARFDPEKGKAFTWMLVIMRNRALDALRQRSRYRETETLSGDVIETLEDDAVSPLDETQGWMIRRLLAPHFSSLAPDVARAVQLSTIDGMSAREIGDVMGVPTNTAKSWVRRGLQQLRKRLEEADHVSTLQDLL